MEQKIAEVIVDVPSLTTDRAYSYLIPPLLQSGAKVGCRVRVPFGHRDVVGYIVSVDTFAPAQRGLKEIIDVIDFVPSLTAELIGLGKKMADAYLCYIMTAFHSMIPAVLKGKMKRKIRIHPECTEVPAHKVFQLLKEKKELGWEEAIKSGITSLTLRKWVADNRLIVRDYVTDKVTIKKMLWVWCHRSKKELQERLMELPETSTAQRKVLQFFLDTNKEVSASFVIKKLKISRSVIKRLVEQGLLSWEEREEYRDPFAHIQFQPSHPLPLTYEQQKALEKILDSIVSNQFNVFLLEGVTGSGKTEIYLQAIAEVLIKGKEAIVLVPEISLTPQMVERFKGRFGKKVAVLHSRLSSGERYDEWRKIKDRKVQVVVGARSAIFAPFENIGLIIVDEEHESSYKQEESPKYDAREIAIWRADYYRAAVVLGSATPSLESRYRVQKNDYTLIQLKSRVNGRPMPEISLIDMREELKKGNRSMFSTSLIESLNRCIERKEQAVLFLNRRGYATFVMCRDCGEVVRCSHCDISLTLHRTNQSLRCHYCGFVERVPNKCSLCNSPHIRHFGTGTQRVEQELLRQFLGVKVIRMDVDTTSKKGNHEHLLSSFARGDATILLGTQMIAKGLDFPNVTLVGVLAADSSLYLPDYRASEKTFQLLVQVSGRAGRHEKPGNVIIQSYNTEHYSISCAAKNQMDLFLKKECMLRKRNAYPPYCGLYTIMISHEDRLHLMKVGSEMSLRISESKNPAWEMLGPVPPPIPRLKDRYRLQFLIKVYADDCLSKLKVILRQMQVIAHDKKLRISINSEMIREEWQSGSTEDCVTSKSDIKGSVKADS